jgi:hypothetical protein
MARCVRRHDLRDRARRLITSLLLLPKSRRYPTPHGNDYPCQQPNQGEYASIDAKDEPALRIEKVMHLVLKMRCRLFLTRLVFAVDLCGLLELVSEI